MLIWNKNDLLKFSLVLLGLVSFAWFISFSLVNSKIWFKNLKQSYENLVQRNLDLEQQYEEAAYATQLVEQEAKALAETKRQLQEEFDKTNSEESKAKLARIEDIFKLYSDTVGKIDRNSKLSLAESDVVKNRESWGTKFLNQEFDQVEADLKQANTDLDNTYSQYLASLPTPTPKPTSTPKPAATTAPQPAAYGYSYQSVSTSRGTFNVYLIKMALAEVTVKTITGNADDCTNDCPAKPLQTYALENNAYAGINGTYFCPPDYASCTNQKYTFNFAVYNSNLNKWLNQPALSWNDLGLITFNGHTPNFYKDSKNYAGQSVSAGISNFPSLLENGSVVVNEGGLSSAQKTRSLRGAIGVDDTNIYLAIVSGASVTDAAYAMQALGAKNALNLDGGGSSALYINGSYKVGPGRQLPNVVLLIR